MNTTKAAQFTPGPWEVTGPYTCEVVTSNAGTYRPIMTIAKVNGYWDGEALANMYLIAAAPAMYKALSMAHNVLYMLKQGFPSEALCSESNPWGQDTGTLPGGGKVSRSAYMREADEAMAIALAQAEGR